VERVRGRAPVLGRLRPGAGRRALPGARARHRPEVREAPQRGEERRPLNRLSYNTNGFAFHRLDDAARILASLGYDGVAWTPDVHHLDPYRSSSADVAAFRELLGELRLSCLVETGARYVLDPVRKHFPTALDEAPLAARRVDYWKRCVDLAAAVGAPVVSVWSGSLPAGCPPAAGFDRLVAALSRLCAHARGAGVRIGFEPEPGMAVEDVEGWTRVRDAVRSDVLGLTLDVGHCLATGEGDPAAILAAHAGEIVVLQVDDHVRGRHEHRMFGEGEVDFASVARAVKTSGYRGPVEVELSRHSSDAVDVARRSHAFLKPLFS
jgi:sugar phosphate isomerase/epimerase